MKLVKTLLLLTFFACNKKDDPVSSQFVGIWKGSYTSTSVNKDNGTELVTIASDGSASGTATSTTYNQSYKLTGSVSTTGVITLTTGSASSNATFSGTLSGNSGSGTWINNTEPTAIYSGNWAATKQ